MSSVYVFVDTAGGHLEADLADITWPGYGGRARGLGLASVADLTGDGLDELLISDVSTDGTATSLVFLAEPGVSESLDRAVLTVTAEPGEPLGSSLASEDVDGDGVPDVLIAHRVLATGSGSTLVFYGPARDNGLTVADADVVVRGEPGDLTGAHLVFEPVLDADGDGNADLLVGCPGTSEAHLFRGPLASSLGLSEASGTFTSTASTGLGANLSSGDFDGDGRDDILLGVPSPSAGGAALVFYGPVPGAHEAASADLVFTLADEGFTAASPGSVDGDAYDDLLVTDPSGDRLLLFRGGAY